MSINLPLPFTAEQVIEQMKADHGIDPTVLYCLVTGRPYGIVPDHEIVDTIRFVDCDDLEQFCDDLAVRIVAGMRPCMNWARVEPESIDFARANDKAGLLAYLINRANESQPSMDMKFEEMMTRNKMRIATYEVCESLVQNADVFELTQLLLQGDAFGNLHRFKPPTVFINKYDRIERCRPTQGNAVSAFEPRFLTPKHLPALLKIVSSWVTGILDSIERANKQALTDARAAAANGNRITTTAYTRSWLTKPVSALSSDAQRRQQEKHMGIRLDKLATAKIRITKKMQAQADVDSIFAEVEAALAQSAKAKQVTAPAAPTIKKPVILRFGAKKG